MGSTELQVRRCAAAAVVHAQSLSTFCYCYSRLSYSVVHSSIRFLFELIKSFARLYWLNPKCSPYVRLFQTREMRVSTSDGFFLFLFYVKRRSSKEWISVLQ
jgi:hypothetical protein